MSLHEKIQHDMVAALKARDAKRRSALSYLASEIKKIAVDRRVNPVPDADCVAIFQKQLKLRQEAIETARTANRADLVENNEYEIGVIQEYLPKAPGADEMRALAEKVIFDLGVTSMKDMAKVMSASTAQNPALDKGAYSAIVKELLSKR